eukprot:366497-Chlamydomonas_euryale.AAC.6
MAAEVDGGEWVQHDVGFQSLAPVRLICMLRRPAGGVGVARSTPGGPTDRALPGWPCPSRGLLAAPSAGALTRRNSQPSRASGASETHVRAVTSAAKQRETWEASRGGQTSELRFGTARST